VGGRAWAIRFYERHGFVAVDDPATLLGATGRSRSARSRPRWCWRSRGLGRDQRGGHEQQHRRHEQERDHELDLRSPRGPRPRVRRAVRERASPAWAARLGPSGAPWRRRGEGGVSGAMPAAGARRATEASAVASGTPSATVCAARSSSRASVPPCRRPTSASARPARARRRPRPGAGRARRRARPSIARERARVRRRIRRSGARKAPAAVSGASVAASGRVARSAIRAAAGLGGHHVASRRVEAGGLQPSGEVPRSARREPMAGPRPHRTGHRRSTGRRRGFQSRASSVTPAAAIAPPAAASVAAAVMCAGAGRCGGSRRGRSPGGRTPAR
jgi:hypothetical protein